MHRIWHAKHWESDNDDLNETEKIKCSGFMKQLNKVKKIIWTEQFQLSQEIVI